MNQTTAEPVTAANDGNHQTRVIPQGETKMTTSESNRAKYTFLRDITASRTSDDSVAVSLKHRSIDVRYSIDATEGWINLNDEDFAALCEADDVSLSEDEKGQLGRYLEEVARN